MEFQQIQVVIYPDGRMDGKNAAKYLGESQKTLAMKRCDGTGPRYIKKGRIFYFKEDLDAYLADGGRVTSTAQLRVARRGIREAKCVERIGGEDPVDG